MRRIFKRLYAFILTFLPPQYYDQFIKITINQLKHTDVLLYAYNSLGILKYENEVVSGEVYALDKIISKYLNYRDDSIIFDVGANRGEYSLTLTKKFPFARVYSFEPNSYTFEVLKENLKDTSVKVFNHGFGNKESRSEIYVYENNTISEHASLYKEFAKVISPELGKLDILPVEIELKTIDGFCIENNIGNIDFIKIDVEGHELSVLEGALNMINHSKIKIIQFEFNVANILSRVFLKDFYDLLTEKYTFFRLDTDRLINLGEYNSANEIFKFQNILAISKNIQ